MKLFAYDHCPFCVKVRMILGIKKIDYDLIILQHNDESTPISMIGCKMVPILEIEPGKYLSESLDIISYIDNSFGHQIITSHPEQQEYAAIAKRLNKATMKLAFPRWVSAPLKEFETEDARQYYIEKKEQLFGVFSELLAKTNELLNEVHLQLKLIGPFIQHQSAVHGNLTIDDFNLFSTLRSLSIVRGVSYPQEVEIYRQTMSEITGVSLHDKLYQNEGIL
ncbi:TPA: glutaredoxin 2 [Legionella pneumophila subsp. pneumophila]|uniref:glutaredoxin 2 n=1 Tax=Legionella sp. PATHC039 TaxID=2992042 RepID=UPI001A20C600|nr:glutaredoxin 2 [Legionella sp. PATHC039]MCW8394109.1 glutaredoxin 2 [Legionella sp. PATHC039]HAT8857678.1 glutaredoxin 2 [Legionella pneumophila subsp. pneumophila]HAT9651855.1 glutaredoxin 2 [Legionella pneumophila subsp. pneumophila]HAT9919241.1 glutaredoxin 2 [Legionella pneumophila subsp. pneumophila]